jgi:hypothetical protein
MRSHTLNLVLMRRQAASKDGNEGADAIGFDYKADGRHAVLGAGEDVTSP